MAQLDITYPVNRMVIQRDNNNQATVQIAGSYAQVLDTIQARVIARATGQGTSTNWANLQVNPTNGQFNGTMTVRGGWYKILVQGKRNGRVVATDSVDRFGVGEVFGIVGHSNAQGSGCYVDGVDKCPTMEGATDDRVTVVALNMDSPEFAQYDNTADTRYLPGLAFSQLLTFSGISPFARVAWFWGRMGDVLVQRINVPVLIYNAGFGGTNMEQNYKAAYDIPFDHGFVKYSIRMPYVNLRNLMNLYVPSTGIRAILLNHGENDRGNPTDQILMHHYGVIDKSRQEFNKPDLAWIVAFSSFVGAPFDNVRSAQYQVINRANYRTFQGPDLDVVTSKEERPDGIHYSPSGQRRVGELWANAITDNILQTAQFYPAQQQPLASVACANGNQLLLTQPDNYEYTWTTGATSQTLATGAGTYSARLRNAQKQVYFPPAVTIPNTVRPAAPTITANGAFEICRSTGVTLTSNYAGPNLWSTGATSSTITATTPGSYTLQAKNAVYGCLSDAVTKTITMAGADLSLSLRVSRRTPVVGDTVTFTMTVRNESGCDAGSTTMQNRLPSNLTFVSSADGLTVANGIVQGTISSVPAGGSVSRRYVARLTAAGTFLNAAELSAQTNQDPDSQPNSGTGDGEDDEAGIDLRTKATGSTSGTGSASSTAVYASPNPNQKPLPDVQSNQPKPDSAKADLSLSLQVSSRYVKVGQPVTFTLTVYNRGGQAATNITVRNDLPASMQFDSSSTGMTATGRAVSGTIAQLGVGQSATLIFRAKATSTTGSFQNVAEITTATPADSDSTPNNTIASDTSKGEDDEARVDLRVSN
ncbi:sialate O-acetylesterase [Spirosoma soli]|uniref:Sialate O-acetylesterase n=1 Tax=Spirosoma soli TaxID=1770529 RepID=A0ABW5M9B4_9BACT